MKMVVIYDRPHDAPAGFVVRQWHVRKDGLIVPGKLLGIDLPTIGDARASVPPGMVNMGRTDTDDAKIVEVWI